MSELSLIFIFVYFFMNMISLISSIGSAPEKNSIIEYFIEIIKPNSKMTPLGNVIAYILFFPSKITHIVIYIMLVFISKGYEFIHPFLYKE